MTAEVRTKKVGKTAPKSKTRCPEIEPGASTHQSEILMAKLMIPKCKMLKFVITKSTYT